VAGADRTDVAACCMYVAACCAWLIDVDGCLVVAYIHTWVG
jgi:hypothetical protein